MKNNNCLAFWLFGICKKCVKPVANKRQSIPVNKQKLLSVSVMLSDPMGVDLSTLNTV